MQYFKHSLWVTLFCLTTAAFWGAYTGLGMGEAVFLALVLGVLEISLSFDNAVVNASVMKKMDDFWKACFLTWGMLVAVLGMRLFFPVAIVAVTSSMGFGDVVTMALENPAEYGIRLADSHIAIAFFGGAFLALVFLTYMLQDEDEKDMHWIVLVETWLQKTGKIEAFAVLVTLAVIMLVAFQLPEAERLSAIASGVMGVITFVSVKGFGDWFEPKKTEEDGSASASALATTQVVRSGAMSFVYLEVLDASFSFDGVIGAFAVVNDIVLIMLGLAIGAMFVRSLTVYLDKKGTLSEFIYLEHGAHWAIGALAAIMFTGTLSHISEVVTGLIGAGFISMAVISSIRWKHKDEAEKAQKKSATA